MYGRPPIAREQIGEMTSRFRESEHDGVSGTIHLDVGVYRYHARQRTGTAGSLGLRMTGDGLAEFRSRQPDAQTIR